MHPGGQHVAGQGVGQEVSVGQHHHPRPQRGQQILRQGLLPTVYGTKLARSAPRSPTPLRPASGPGETLGPSPIGRAREVLAVLGRVRDIAGGTVHRRHRSPQQNTRGAGSAAEPSPEPPARPPTGPATASNSMCSGSDPNLALARARLEMWTAATAAPARHPPHRPDQAAHPAAASPGGGDTARRPACSSPGRSRSCGRGTATTPTRSTPPAGPAATGDGPPGCRSPPPPDPPAPAGTSWSRPIRQPPLR